MSNPYKKCLLLRAMQQTLFPDAFDQLVNKVSKQPKEKPLLRCKCNPRCKIPTKQQVSEFVGRTLKLEEPVRSNMLKLFKVPGL